MFRDKGFKPKPVTMNFILMDGGVGDHIASLTALNYIHNKYPYVKQLVWVPDFLLEFAQHLLPKLLIRDFSSMRQYYDHTLPTKATKWDQIVSPMKTSCLDYAFMKLCDEKPSIEHMNYLQINTKKIDLNIPLPENYVVITTGYTAKVREFPTNEINKLIDYLKTNNITPVFLGKKDTPTGTKHIIKGTFSEDIQYSQGLDLVDKTSLLQAAKIMGGAKAVVGVDNGLLHIAATTQVPIIAGYTTVDPIARIPVRNNQLGHNYYTITPDQSLSCRFCQSNTNFIFKHDYKECLYKDYACTSHMTAEKFINQLKAIL